MEALKAKGNEAFKKGEFARAAALYKDAVAAGHGVAAAVKEGDEGEKQRVRRELAALHSNASAALLKLGRVAEAVQEAERSTEERPDWSKGWFRKGEALFARRDYTGAEDSYKRSLDLSPDDVTVKKCLMLSLEAQQGFFFRQLFAGREFCIGSGGNMVESQIFHYAQQMRNFVYLIGDAHSREVVVVDGAWDVNGILRVAEAERVNVVGAVVTHYHFDHTGGLPPPPFDSLGIRVPGIRELATKHNLKVYVHRADAAVLRSKNGVPASSIVELEDNSSIKVGSVTLRFMHTPGHTPGSQCIHIEKAGGFDDGVVLSGDTLFIGSCGRLDLPDCNAHAMYGSLQKKLANLPDATRVYPGHDYGGAFTTIEREKKTGLLRPISEADWMKQKGRQ